MDGLLAWAADVVGANSDPESPAAIRPRFTREQLEEIEKIEKRALELQQSIQQLRQRLPPPNIAQRLPHLHAESLASQSALALELHAHSASRIQAQIRESSLKADIEAYKEALAATEQQTIDRNREAEELQKSLQELDERERELKEECEELERSLPKEDDAKLENILEDIPLEEETNELQTLKAELAKWQTKVAESRKELSMAESEALAWPSSAQREKDLERRLRTLTEQLAAKQAQAEKLMIERDDLELRVEHATLTRRTPAVDQAAKRNKIGIKQTRTRLNRYINTTSSSKNLVFRSLIVVYVFLLHVVVLVVLSNSNKSPKP